MATKKCPFCAVRRSRTSDRLVLKKKAALLSKAAGRFNGISHKTGACEFFVLLRKDSQTETELHVHYNIQKFRTDQDLNNREAMTWPKTPLAWMWEPIPLDGP